MINKKQLIEELLDCVADATDTETKITSLTMAGTLMNEVLDKALTIPDVSQQRELLLAYNSEVNQYMENHLDLLDERDVDGFLANNCG